MKYFFAIFPITTILSTNAILANLKPEVPVRVLSDQNFNIDHFEKHEAYALYKQKFNKPIYNSNLEYRRYDTFLQNVEKIRQHNERYERGEETYKMGINKFADMLPEEMERICAYQYQKKPSALRRKSLMLTSSIVGLPEKVDWRIKGAITPVKDQGDCGSCWAISAVGALEAQHFRRTRRLIPLSIQNLIDCSRSYNNFGCDGGLPDRAYEYIFVNEGIDSESSYPYEEKDGPCRYSNRTRATTVHAIFDLYPNDEKLLQKVIATVGPVATSLNTKYLKLYEEGIFTHNNCSSKELDHSVVVVGYGSEELQEKNGTMTRHDYWIIKNSWGTQWGESGYARIARNKGNMCGIASVVCYPGVWEDDENFLI